jgi:hypothetical protein
MQPELRVLGQQPVKASLAGIEIAIYPPTIYRLQEIIDAVLDVTPTFAIFAKQKLGELLNKDESSDKDETEFRDKLKLFVTEFIGKSAVALQLMCTSPTGEIPDELTKDEFWFKQTTTSAIVQLVAAFVDLIDLESLLKKVRPLMGLGLGSGSRGRLS